MEKNVISSIKSTYGSFRCSIFSSRIVTVRRCCVEICSFVLFERTGQPDHHRLADLVVDLVTACQGDDRIDAAFCQHNPNGHAISWVRGDLTSQISHISRLTKDFRLIIYGWQIKLPNSHR